MKKKASRATTPPAATTTTTKPAPGRRAEHRAMRHEEILATALELVSERGLAGLTTTELARRNGAALGALYRFFPSKQAVIAALQAQAFIELQQSLVDAVARARALPLPKRAALWAPFIALGDTWLGERERNPARFRLIDEVLSAPDPVYDDAEARPLERGVNELLAIVRGGVDDAVAVVGPSADPATARRFPFAMWGALHGVSHFQKRDRLVDPDFQSARVASSTIVLLLRGLGAVDADIDAAFRALAPSTLLR
jgi:AcrR family transcriptional regulator